MECISLMRQDCVYFYECEAFQKTFSWVKWFLYICTMCTQWILCVYSLSVEYVACNTKHDVTIDCFIDTEEITLMILSQCVKTSWWIIIFFQRVDYHFYSKNKTMCFTSECIIKNVSFVNRLLIICFFFAIISGYFHRQLLIHRRKIALKRCMSKR